MIDIPIFYFKDLPNAATHCDQALCPLSLYRGILVQWDEDADGRVLGVIDAMPDHVREKLLVVQEHEGAIMFMWKDAIPDGYAAGSVQALDGDDWDINSSVVVKNLMFVCKCCGHSH